MSKLEDIFSPIIDSSISDRSSYEKLCSEYRNDPNLFWHKQASQKILWHRLFDRVLNPENPPFCRWFEGGKLNISFNCLDKHIGTPIEHQVAITFINSKGKEFNITYIELLKLVSRIANAMKRDGLKIGDRVLIYMPMSIEIIAIMQACARLGIIHSVVFSGFSAMSLGHRIQEIDPHLIITANAMIRGHKIIPLKQIVDEAVHTTENSTIKKIVIYQAISDFSFDQLCEKDIYFDDWINQCDDTCVAEAVDSNHPLFILYTSGSTGKPKGILHSTAGYFLWILVSMEWVFNIQKNDVFWCTADVGWITGHSYIAYAPLASGLHQVIHENLSPDHGNYWEIIEKQKVSIFYTAPTILRILRKNAQKSSKINPNNWNLSSLRILGSVGEPLNSEVWKWYYEYVGHKNCAIVDTFFQTETGGHLITHIPSRMPMLPGYCGLPLPGIEAVVINELGEVVNNGIKGMLAIKNYWPGLALGIWKDTERFKNIYFPEKMDRKYYLVGDSAVCEEKYSYFQIIGRTDDILNVSGHRLGVCEIESALISCKEYVIEAAVVSKLDEITGEAIVAIVVLNENKSLKLVENRKEIFCLLQSSVVREVGAIAKLHEIYFVSQLPKTRSGKIMRRLLKNLVRGEGIQGDISTLENIDFLVDWNKNQVTQKI